MQTSMRPGEMHLLGPQSTTSFLSVFGFMDQLVRSKPNISTLSVEAYVVAGRETLGLIDGKMYGPKSQSKQLVM